MDDLEHSVVIAERDWESFYEESEECSIQPAWLASLDNSSLSDTDDDDDCKSEKPECSSYKSDNNRSSVETAEISMNDVSTTHACSISDSSVGVNNTDFTDQHCAASDVKDLREYNENHSVEKSCQAIGEPTTSISCIQDSGHVGSSEGETVVQDSESLATPKKEKERWFVTVNDSPGMLRVKSGQKKGRKKKTSRKLARHSIVKERQSSVSDNSNNKEEKEVMNDGQILQNECMQPSPTHSEHIYFNPYPNQYCEEVILGSCNTQEVAFPPFKEPEKKTFEKLSIPKINYAPEASSFIAENENTSCAFSLKCKDYSDFPIKTIENNPTSSVNSPSQLILTDKVNEQIATNPKSNKRVTIPDHPTSANLSHKTYEDTQSDDSRLILRSIPKLSSQEIQKESLEAAVSSNCPVFALSSFWDEMEKLTINDILHLRSVHNRSPMSRSVISDESDLLHLEDKKLVTTKHDGVQESGLLDDSADSDYFTHVDETKPDRSSCELSTFSDCDEEFLQILNKSGNPTPEPQHFKEQTENLTSRYIPGYEFDPNIETKSLDFINLSRQNGIPHYSYPAIEVQSLFLKSSQDTNGNPFELEDIRKTPVLSFDNTADDQSMLTFSDISGAGSSDTLSSTVASFPFVQDLSVCEMYDDFFADFEIGNFLFPPTQDKTVPIFSASRSGVRDLVFPQVEELDFGPDFEQDNMAIRDLAPFSSQSEMSTCPSGTSNLCFSMSQTGNWSSLFSLRRIRFIGKGSTWHHKVSSWIFPKEAKETSYVSRAQLMQVGNNSLLAEPHQCAIFISSRYVPGLYCLCFLGIEILSFTVNRHVENSSPGKHKCDLSYPVLAEIWKRTQLRIIRDVFPKILRRGQ